MCVCVCVCGGGGGGGEHKICMNYSMSHKLCKLCTRFVCAFLYLQFLVDSYYSFIDIRQGRVLHTSAIIWLTQCQSSNSEGYIEGLVQDCSNSISNALELLSSCTKPSIYEMSHYQISTMHKKGTSFFLRTYPISIDLCVRVPLQHFSITSMLNSFKLKANVENWSINEITSIST